MTREKNILNKKEKQEIVLDVKKALDAKVGFKNKETKKTIKIIVFSIIVVLIISLGAFYLYFRSNPRTLFVNSLETFWDTLDRDLVFNDSLSGSADIGSNVKIGNHDLEKYNYKIDYLTDGINNSFLWKVYKENELLSEVTFDNKDNGYVYIPNLYNNYIGFNDNYYNYKNGEIIVKSLNKALLKSINNYKISNTKVVLKIDGKLVNTNKITISLNNEDVKEVLDKVSDYLRSDYNFQSNYGSMFKKYSFDDVVTSLRNSFQNSNLEINIYMDRFKHSFVRLELVDFKNNLVNVFKVIKIRDNKYYIAFDDKESLVSNEYMVSTKKLKNGSIYKINVLKKKNNNVVLDMDTSIKLRQNDNINIIGDTDSMINYDNLSNEEKLKVDEILKPIKIFRDEMFIK